jgi:predicted ester cyclase
MPRFGPLQGQRCANSSRAAGRGLWVCVQRDPPCLYPEPREGQAVMGQPTATSSIEQIASDFVKLWDASSPPGLAERAYAPEYIEHNPLPGQGPGIVGLNQLTGLYFAAFPDLTTRVETVLSDGALTAVRWSGEGTQEGDLMGIAPTHHRVHFSGIDILRIANGKIIEHWGESNGLEVMQQLQGPGPKPTT